MSVRKVFDDYNNNLRRLASSLLRTHDVDQVSLSRTPQDWNGCVLRRLQGRIMMTKRFITHCAMALLAANATAQTIDDAPMQRVEITGSSIRRIANESSLPLTSIRAEEFARQGLTTAQQVLNSIPMNQTSVSSAQSVGAGTGGQSQADLRGLGGQRTLVLLNGRRIASHPILGDSVDLNVIPLSALD